MARHAESKKIAAAAKRIAPEVQCDLAAGVSVFEIVRASPL